MKFIQLLFNQPLALRVPPVIKFHQSESLRLNGLGTDKLILIAVGATRSSNVDDLN